MTSNRAIRPINIGILEGSARKNSNTNGIARWVKDHLGLLPDVKTTPLPLTSYPLPLGPLYDDIVPKALRPVSTNPDGTKVYPYPTERVRDFSGIVQSLDGLVIVTPQYNWSIPGELKNTIDHLLNEWVDLPIAAVTYGSRGGDKVAEALKMVITGIGAKEISVGKIMIPLPKDTHIAGSERVQAEDDLLKSYEAVLKEELGKLVDAAVAGRESKAE